MNAIEYLRTKIPKDWGIKLPDKAIFSAINEEIPLKPGQLYLDLGEVVNYMDFYNSFANAFNSHRGSRRYGALEAFDEGKKETRLIDIPFFGGIQFSMPFTFTDLSDVVSRHELFVICYTPLKSNGVSRPFIRGNVETEAILDMGLLRYSTLSELVHEDQDRKLIANVGGIYAAGMAGFTRDEIIGYLSIGNPTSPEHKHCLEEAIATFF